MAKELQEKGHRIGRYLARSLMREAGIASRQRRRHKYKSSGVEALVAPHVLKREFDVTAVNQVWCGDVTYIKVGKRWLYFAAILDLFARRIVGWSFSMISDATLTCEALRMAVELRGRPKEVLFHSDQGCQGGFNRSSQHLDRGVYGTTRRMDAKIDGAGSDAFSRCTLTS